MYLFLTQTKWYSFIQIDRYIKYNCIFNFAKNIKDESANKLTTSELIEYNGKMPTTNNMIKLNSPECPSFWICNVDVQIIDWICNWLKLIFEYELNEHRNKTEKTNAATMTANNKTPHSDDEITTEKKKLKTLIYVKITY